MIENIGAGASVSAPTSVSLLERAKDRDPEAWGTLTTLYTPLVYRWARKAGLQAHDAEDVVQNVFLAVASDFKQFRRHRPGDSFRGWLWTIFRHKILDYFHDRQHQPEAEGGSTARFRYEQLGTPGDDIPEASDDRCRLRHRALALLCELFENHIWQAFLRTVIHGDHPTDVATDLGVSVATVYRARFRVLERLRSELEGD